MNTTMRLARFPTVADATPGLLVVEQGSTRWWCYTMEDEVRPIGVKIPGRTAIPAGLYTIRLTMSPRFRMRLPLLIGNQEFERNWSGVRIHAGNSPKDTDGCILPGLTLARADFVQSSVPAMNGLMAILGRSTDTVLRIYNSGDVAP